MEVKFIKSYPYGSLHARFPLSETTVCQYLTIIKYILNLLLGRISSD